MEKKPKKENKDDRKKISVVFSASEWLDLSQKCGKFYLQIPQRIYSKGNDRKASCFFLQEQVV